MQSIFSRLKINSFNKLFSTCIEDSTGQKFSYFSFYLKILFLSEFFKKNLQHKKVGILLPNTSTFPLIALSLNKIGFISAIFNYKSSSKVILSCAKSSDVKVLITSKKFEQKANLENLIKEISSEVKIIYLEDMLCKINFFDKIYNITKGFFSEKYIPKSQDEVSLILYTSGSESTPKGVALSNKNIISNLEQILERMSHLSPKDIFFSSLPFFHSFGLTCGMLFPLLLKSKIFIYHNPLDYKIIPKKIKESKANIFFSTNSFLQSYSNFAEKEDFENLKYIVAGGEKLQNNVIKIYKDKFDLEVYQGYGATEASPVIAVEVPSMKRENSVGKPLKDLEIIIEKIEGYTKAGNLLIKGDNIMLGYYLSSNPGILQKNEKGWYCTGDVAYCDFDGFLFLEGRLKRFAKIAGEMVSLTMIESIISEQFPNETIGCLSQEDEKKGEKIVLFVTNKDILLEKIEKNFIEKGYSNIYLPKKLILIEEIPLLPNGKVDFITLKNYL
jgi:acyl-[acyl-carrier-protein]-phospholipid O-acyltransferase/long-chain-fatty-acid--[acyl-carrier-protein] ligase